MKFDGSHSGAPAISRSFIRVSTSIRIASSTLLELHDPQSPTPEMTRSVWARRAWIPASSTSWLAERFRFRTVTVI